jgi:hypothetical protein
MLPLIERLIEKAQYYTEKHSKKLLRHIPSRRGQFAINIKDPAGPVFQRVPKDKEYQEIIEAD